jgi:hypothetical protein
VNESALTPQAESAKGELVSTPSSFPVFPSPVPSPVSDARPPGEPVREQETMAGLLEKLQEIGAIDPAAQQHLMAQLRTAEPKYWSSMVEQFQSAMALRQQLAARDSKQSGSLADLKRTELATSGSVNRVSIAQGPVATQEPIALVESDRQNSQVVLLDSPSAESSLPPSGRKSDAVFVGNQDQRAAPAESTVRAVSYQPDKGSPHGSLSPRDPHEQNPPAETDTWERIIALMEESVTEVPDSTEDIHQQMRLRMLYFVAGRQEDALRPISGATPAQQDYWSQQLFALATFLDNQSQPDNKRRAAAALLHLDEARGTLAQLATLDVRNLTFVKSVDGYGVYELSKESQFEPGQQVALYAEVENFHSDSTDQGFRIALGTSYQVVDESGRRVDGGQFPDVLDQCKNRRRDFHIQYGIPLPTRIYPGSYQLQLIVTDNQTGKIGQATLPFKIAEEHR